eukprot:CAMPEP_0204151572 /NCGR_PEP_ID=MMETSP0361-20130328/26266_1 /ASSEMBLY_ACC=CAM_ASM_000343 /TAXON_ID=268821 /ORGANISM="Scrippsiella Hangoei, Strain SHTV-5" /LENGTH=226 /DNA_ID=CAMNT_0051106407 /DNA_START=92 /DNA_END=767 /DNA_ORIENTATION=-
MGPLPLLSALATAILCGGGAEALAATGAAAGPALLRSAPDALARATMQIKGRLRRLGRTHSQAATTEISCNAAAQAIGAMSCSLVTQISGYPEGCECRMQATECPPADAGLGFTGVSPSLSVSLPEMGGSSLILCMYWQWDNAGEALAAPPPPGFAPPPPPSATARLAQQLVKSAEAAAVQQVFAAVAANVPAASNTAGDAWSGLAVPADGGRRLRPLRAAHAPLA